jgi:hypothetical protein
VLNSTDYRDYGRTAGIGLCCSGRVDSFVYAHPSAEAFVCGESSFRNRCTSLVARR